MSETQLKQLATMTLMNSSILAKMSDSLLDVYEKLVPFLNDQRHANSLLHSIEQMQAMTRTLSQSLPRCAEEFGVDWRPSGS
jgi:hypothetical protein